MKGQAHHAKWLSGLLAVLFFVDVSAIQPGPGQPESLGNGSFSRMSMTLVRKFVFVQVEVLDLEVHFGFETADRIESLARGRNLSIPLADSIAEIATQSTDALIRLRFLRDLDLDRFIREARRNTKMVYEAAVITKDTYDKIARELPSWYSSLQARGIKKDDSILYRVRGDHLRAIYRGFDGKVYLEHQNSGPEQRLALLGSYFVPKSEFRDRLIRSLFLSETQPPDSYSK